LKWKKNAVTKNIIVSLMLRVLCHIQEDLPPILCILLFFGFCLIDNVLKQRTELIGIKFMKFYKDPMSQIERQIWKLLTKHKTVLPASLKYKLTLYNIKPPHLCGLPKIHKPEISLRPIVSSTNCPCYALADFLHTILSPQVGNTESFVDSSDTS
jgi:hypothetical protein